MSLEELISKLGIGKKEVIYLSITPGVGLELIQLNVQTKTVKNYGYKPLHYNESLRELADLESFKTALTELFTELKISMRCDVVLNIPMVLLGSRELPILLADEAVTEALTSEVEQSYIFKRYEPVVSWVDVTNTATSGENRKLFYSAIQKNVIDDIKNIMQELGMSLADIHLSMFSVIRALMYSGFLEKQTKDGVTWNLMLISSNGYSITSMVGKNVVDYYEEPLAIKSFDGEELYSAMNASAQIALMSYPANYLVVVSETDLLSAELLINRLQFDGTVSCYENNEFKKGNLIDVDYQVLEDDAHKISLEAIGNVVTSLIPLSLDFNFMGGSAGKAKEDDPDTPIHVVLGNFELDISQNGARNVALLFAVVLLIPFLLLFLALPLVNKQKQAQLEDVKSKLEQTKQQIKTLETEQDKYEDFDVNNEVKKAVANNRTKVMSYIALGESVPKDLYLTYFVAQGDGKIDIKGQAATVQDVSLFYSNVKDSMINVPLRLQKLEMNSKSLDSAVSGAKDTKTGYSFEITNMSGSDAPVSQGSQENENANNETKPAADGNSNNVLNEDMLNKPLLNFGKGN
ncbi:hypothetical protein J6P92_07145 [bacterium]|nr:hypothetical protein [bacterium]